jgi:hypothetical protein
VEDKTTVVQNALQLTVELYRRKLSFGFGFEQGCLNACGKDVWSLRWKRCMEFAVKNSAGKLEKHFIDPRTGTAQKVEILLRVIITILLNKWQPTQSH